MAINRNNSHPRDINTQMVVIIYFWDNRYTKKVENTLLFYAILCIMSLDFSEMSKNLPLTLSKCNCNNRNNFQFFLLEKYTIAVFFHNFITKTLVHDHQPSSSSTIWTSGDNNKNTLQNCPKCRPHSTFCAVDKLLRSIPKLGVCELYRLHLSRHNGLWISTLTSKNFFHRIIPQLEI